MFEWVCRAALVVPKGAIPGTAASGIRHRRGEAGRLRGALAHRTAETTQPQHPQIGPKSQNSETDPDLKPPKLNRDLLLTAINPEPYPTPLKKRPKSPKS